MNEHIKLLIEDIKKLWLKLDINQKFAIAALLLAMIVIGVFFIFKATEPNWSILYSDLTKDDVAAISESLKKSGYAFKISDDKSAIMVREQDKEDLRMFVAQNDLIRDTSSGFELLDDLALGSTDFKNKLTKQRIFQGELTRSIEKIRGVKKARVQLAEPERSIFSDEDEEPSASVVLILEPGVKLKPSQVLAIKNLVAYSVPRLTNDRVFLTDQFGNVLSEDVSKNSSDMQTYRANFEKEAAKKIQDTLETIMGKDNVSVQVSTVMDFNQTRSTIESYTPNKDSDTGVVISRQGEKEVYSNPQAQNQKKEEGEAQNQGQPEAPQTAEQIAAQQAQNIANERAQNPNLNQAQGASEAQGVGNLPLNQTPAKTTNYGDSTRANNAGDVKKLSYEKEKSATTYAVTKEVKQVVYAPGSVVRMSVAVAVNKILTDTEKEEIKNLVQAAAGVDYERGDVINVTSLKFTGIDADADIKQEQKDKRDFTMEVLAFIFKNVVPAAVILILGLIALNNLSNLFKAAKQREEQLPEASEPVEEIPSFDPYLMLQQNQTTPDDFYQQNIEYASAVDKKKSEIVNTVLSNPEEAARILTSYMKD